MTPRPLIFTVPEPFTIVSGSGGEPTLAYDPVSGTWRALAPVPAGAWAAVWGDGRVYGVPEGASGDVADGELFSFTP